MEAAGSYKMFVPLSQFKKQRKLTYKTVSTCHSVLPMSAKYTLYYGDGSLNIKPIKNILVNTKYFTKISIFKEVFTRICIQNLPLAE